MNWVNKGGGMIRSIQSERSRRYGIVLGMTLITLTAYADLPPGTFVNIADTTTGELTNLAAPAVNNTGVVAFAAQIPAGGRGVYTGSISTPVNTFGSIIVVGSKDSIGRPAINNAGLVAVQVSYDIGGHQMIVGAGGSFDIIADNTGPALIMGTEIGINDSGDVVFSGSPVFGSANQAIHIGNNSTPTNTLTTIATLGDGFTSVISPDINTGGMVCFTGRSSIDLSWRLYTGGAGKPITSVVGSGTFPFRGVINDSGSTVFYSTASGTSGLYINGASGTQPFVTIGGEFTALSEVAAINNMGVVAFIGTTSAGVGIYAGPDPVEDRLIGVGDALFGSTISSLELARHGLNDAGQLAFEYALASGVEGIAVANLDSDGDGLLDIWESQGGGIDSNGDGVIDLSLYERGARPDHKDLFYELDRMSGVPYDEEGVVDVIEAFSNAPLMNPDGTTGITLHIELASVDMIPFDDSWNDLGDEYAASKVLYYGSVAEREDPNSANLLAAKRLCYRYAVIVNNFDDGGLGVAETPGDDLALAFADLEYEGVVQGSTFMHEIGHNLNLGHGGVVPGSMTSAGIPETDDTNYKPNYVSVMNYGFDEFTTGSGSSLPIDFSREVMPTIDESMLDETAGIVSMVTPDVWVFHGVRDPGESPRIVRVRLTSIMHDWNGDMMFDTSVVGDLNWLGDGNPDGSDPSPGQSLTGCDDWNNIVLRFADVAEYQQFQHIEPDYEDYTYQELLTLRDNVPPPPGLCPADLNNDGELNFFDVSAFLVAFNAMDPIADFTGDGSYDFFDVSAFLVAFNAGCP